MRFVSIASSKEGGAGAHRQCIARFQNQLGGKLYQSYASKKHFGLKNGDPYIIRVVPGCNTAARRAEALSKDNTVRLAPRATASASATIQTVEPTATPVFLQDPIPGAVSGSGYYLSHLSGAPAGDYQLVLNMSGIASVSEVTITDGDGSEYAM